MLKIKLKKFVIGIDTGHDKKFSYISYGPESKINELKSDIEHICIRNGIKKNSL